MKKDTQDLARMLCINIPQVTYNMLDREEKKGKIRLMLEEDPDLFDEVMMEIRKEKIEKIRNK